MDLGNFPEAERIIKQYLSPGYACSSYAMSHLPVSFVERVCIAKNEANKKFVVWYEKRQENLQGRILDISNPVFFDTEQEAKEYAETIATTFRFT